MRTPRRRRRRALLLLAGAALILAPAAWRAEAEQAYVTRHLEVSGPVDARTVEEAAALGEALFEALERRFGARPLANALPLVLRLLPDRDAFLRALPDEARAGRLEGAGGWTSEASGVSTIWLQPEAFDTRRLVLHELTHQFLKRLAPQSMRTPVWYREGIAEHFGWHRRTPEGVVFGALDALAFTARPEQAFERVRRGDFDAWAVGSGRGEADWTDAMILFETLVRTEDEELRQRFGVWEREALRHGDAGSRFLIHFEGMRARLAVAVKAVWRENPRRWRPLERGFDEDRGAITGRAGVRPAVLAATGGSREGVSAIAVTVESAGALGAGPCLAVVDATRWVAAEVRARRLVLVRQDALGERILAEGTIPEPLRRVPLRVHLALEGRTVVARVLAPDGPTITAEGPGLGLDTEDLEGALGLIVRDGEARYRDVALGRAASPTADGAGSR